MAKGDNNITKVIDEYSMPVLTAEKMNDAGVENLSYAIVKNAINDYKLALRYIRKKATPQKMNMIRNLDDLIDDAQSIKDDLEDSYNIKPLPFEWTTYLNKPLRMKVLRQRLDRYEKWKKKIGAYHIIDAYRNKYDCENFFKSSWFETLCPNVDGKELLKQIRLVTYNGDIKLD